MIVMKFGGTSVGTAGSIRATCSIIKSRLARKPLVVVSAHNSPTCRMTDTLIKSAKEALAGNPDPSAVIGLQRGVCKELGIDSALVDDLLARFSDLLTGICMIGEISPRTLDLVMSFGERMSHRVLAHVLHNEFGVPSKAISSMELGLETDGNFGEAQPKESSYPQIKKNVEAAGDCVIVTTGFLGKGPDGHITTLGRGGSDYSGTIFGAAVGAQEVEIWTDVDGVMSADPKTAPAAHSIPELTFAEAAELSWYGAKVLHPSTMIPAMRHGIPVRVLNTHQSDRPGTVILDSRAHDQSVCKSIAHKRHISMMTITSSRMLGMHGFMAKVFTVCSKYEIDIHMIATSEVSITLTVAEANNLDRAAEELREYGEVKVEHDKAIVCVVGQSMSGVPGVAARVTGALARGGVNIRMISQGATEINIALLVEDGDALKAVSALHDEVFAK